MDIIEVKDTKCFRKGLPIGHGTSAKCYKIDKDIVAKLFYSPFYCDNFINHKEVIRKFETLISVSNDTYIGPKTLIVCNGKYVGYLYDFVKGKTLHKENSNIKIADIINNYDKLLEDTVKISSKKFKLYDLHDRNIIRSNKGLKVIDLDRGYLDLHNTYLDIIDYNMKSINKTIIHSLYKARKFDTLIFYNDKLNELYKKSIKEDYRLLPIFLEETEKNSGKCKVKYKSIRKNIDFNIEKNDYYHF